MTSFICFYLSASCAGVYDFMTIWLKKRIYMYGMQEKDINKHGKLCVYSIIIISV